VRRLLPVLALVLLAASGCARPRPVTAPPPPPLEVPPPPPRVIVPPDLEPAVPASDNEGAPPKGVTGRPGHVAPKPKPAAEAPKPPEVKPEPPTAETAKPTNPAAQLQPTLPAAAQTEMERQLTDQLALAKKDLDRVDYRALGADARAQYDAAKRFITQADEARRNGNLVMAARLAEKAVGLAVGLVPR
jgi:hypothetical protein